MKMQAPFELIKIEKCCGKAPHLYADFQGNGIVIYCLSCKKCERGSSGPSFLGCVDCWNDSFVDYYEDHF